MILLSAFSILILFLNPALWWIFTRLELNLQKYHFWILITSGAAWLLSLAAFLLQPEQTLNLFWDIGSPLLPGSIFTLDQVSSTLLLAVTAIIFAGILFQQYSPPEAAWISGFGGICSLALLADSPFTVLLLLTLMEIALLVNFLLHQDQSALIRRMLLAVIFRTICPLLILYASLLSGYQNAEGTFSTLDPSAGPLLIAAGLFSTAGWFAIFNPGAEDLPGLIPRPFSELLPGSVGLMVVIRGGMLLAEKSPLAVELALAGSVLVIGLAGYLLRKPRLAWQLSTLGLVAGAALSGVLELSLAWSLIVLLPGFLLTRPPGDSSWKLPILVGGGLGLISLPFFPIWSGAGLFHPGLPGYFFAMGFGLAGGALLKQHLEGAWPFKFPPGTLNLPLILAALIPFLTQCLIAFRAGLVQKSLAPGAVAISAWMPSLILLAAILSSIRLPTRLLDSFSSLSAGLEPSSSRRIAAGRSFLGRIIAVLAGLFEGEGGLIWALLIAFLIVSLISLGGG